MSLVKEFEAQGNKLFKYRGQIPLVLLVAGVAFYNFVTLSSDFDFPFNHIYWEIFCVITSLLGLVVRGAVIGTVPKNTSGRNTKAQVADTLNNTGIYSLLRHPLYLGNFLMWLGPVLYLESVWFLFIFILLYWLYYERIMFAEEQFLRKKFTDYDDWSAVTPPFLPTFRNYQKPNYAFSFRHVIKREYYGVLKLFLVFYLYSLFYDLKVYGEVLPFNTWHDYMLYFSILFFIVVRIFHKKTDLLKVEGR